MHFKIVLLIALVSWSLLHAQNSTQLRPLECFQADQDDKVLTQASTFATVWYVVPYRVFPPLFTWILSSLKTSQTAHETDWSPTHLKIVSTLTAILASALGEGSDNYVLTTAAHAGSIISYIVPSYWINRSGHSKAKCEYALDVQLRGNHSKPLACYNLDADKKSGNQIITYSFGVVLGAYVLLPVIISGISQCLKKKNAPQTDATIAAPADVESGGVIAGGLTDGLQVGANMGGKEKPLLDAAVFLPISLFLVPLWAWFQKGNSQAECDYASQ